MCVCVFVCLRVFESLRINGRLSARDHIYNVYTFGKIILYNAINQLYLYTVVILDSTQNFVSCKYHVNYFSSVAHRPT